MLERLEVVYDVIENLIDKGYEVNDLEIHDHKVIIKCENKRYGLRTTTTFNIPKTKGSC